MKGDIPRCPARWPWQSNPVPSAWIAIPLRKAFQLVTDDGRAAWGTLSLDQVAGQGCSLALSWALGDLQSATPLPAPLVKWYLCPEQRSVAPKTGTSQLGPEESIIADWQVDGSQSDCQNISISFSIADQTLASACLSESRKNWEGLLVSGEIFAHCALEYVIAPGDEVRVMMDCRYAQSPITDQTLETWPPPPCPPPLPPQGPETPVIGDRRPKEDLAAIVSPAGIAPPTSIQKQRRFIDMKNPSIFQNTLAKQKTLADQQAQARDFLDPKTQTYPGQYVTDIRDLPAPMGNLQGETMMALWRFKADPDVFMAKLVALLECSIPIFLSNTGYPPAKVRVQNSTLALILSRSGNVLHQDALIRFQILCHACEYLNGRNHPGPGELSELLEASCLIPAAVHCESPVKSESGYVSPLGVAQLQTLDHSLSRYEPGELAHVENIMQGENREQELSKVLSKDSLETERGQANLSEDLHRSRQGVMAEQDQTHTDPSLSLTREFNKLNNQYGSDGLSDSVTGGWTDSTQTKSPENLAARHRTQDLLDRAASQVSRRIRNQRQKQLTQSLTARHLCRYTNDTGQAHLIGIYRWVDQVYHARLTPEGQHLFLEFILPRPAEKVICRESALHGRDLSIPPAPTVKTQGGKRPLAPGDVTRTTYLTLAAQYGLRKVPPAPPATITVSATLCADPPQNTAAVRIPRGYFPQKALISYAISAASPAPFAPEDTALTLVVFLGAHQKALKVPPDDASGQVSLPLTQPEGSAPGSVPKTGQIRSTKVPLAVMASPDCRYTINVLIQCACLDQGALYRQWQRKTCQLILEGYQTLKATRIHELERYFASTRSPGRVNGVARDTLKTRAIDCLVHDVRPAPDPEEKTSDADFIYFRLIPFFSRALAWSDMSHTYFPDFFGPDAEDRPYLYALGPDSAPGDDLDVFLQAGAVRLLVPVHRAYALSLLYFLSSQGSFWLGKAPLTPVFEKDIEFVNQLKSIRQAPLAQPAPASWEFRVATAMLWLQPGNHLPDFKAQSQTKAARP